MNLQETITTLSTQGSYQNNREVNVGGLPYTMREILVTAPLLAGLNVYLVGATGEGKTQLANDLAGFTGDGYCYAQGRPDFEPSEILKQLNLTKIREGATDRELVELTENVHKALYYVDELNRCPPIIQNYFFDFFDGKLVHDGKILQLGQDGYAVGYASGNIGNGSYVGTEDSDRALKDRMHLIVKVDDPKYCTTAGDDAQIFSSKKNPRASAPDKGKDILEGILSAHQNFGKRTVPAILPLLGVFFHKGLDYVENSRRHSKRAIEAAWPSSPSVRQDTDESKIMPLSKRAIFSTMGLTESLAMIAESKGYQVQDSAQLFLDALSFTVPYSGVLSDQFVYTEMEGDTYAAFDAVMEGMKREVMERKNDLEVALALANHGVVDEKILDNIGQGRWAPVRQALISLAKNPSSEAMTFDQLKGAHKQ